MSNFQTSSRCRMATVVILFAGLLTACLGQDFLNAPLRLDGLENRWLARESPLVLEVVADGDRIEVFEVFVNVVDVAPDGE